MFFRKNKTIDKNHENKSRARNFTQNENIKLECPDSYGYLAIRPKDSPIPQECLCCLKVIDCLSKTKK